MNAPKIVEAWKACDGYHLFGPDGEHNHYPPADPTFDDRDFTSPGQRIVWPEGYGRATVEDLPPPPPTALEILERVQERQPVGVAVTLSRSQLDGAIAAIREGRAQ